MLAFSHDRKAALGLKSPRLLKYWLGVGNLGLGDCKRERRVRNRGDKREMKNTIYEYVVKRNFAKYFLSFLESVQ